MKLTVPLARDVVMLLLGSGGMGHELFLVPAPNMARVWVSIGLLLGPAGIAGWWRLRNPEPISPASTGMSPSSSPSSSPPPGS